MLDAVLFDFNGVLVDDEHLHLQCFNAVLRPRGVSVTDEEYQARYIGFDDRGAFVAIASDRGMDAPKGLVDALIAEKSVEYARLAATELRVFEGAVELLRSAARVCPVAVVSGALRAEIHSALELMGVLDLVACVVAAEDVSECKPHPEGYRRALAALQGRFPELRAERSVALEDTVFGLQSALSAGLRAVGVVNGAPEGQGQKLTRAGAHCVFEATRDIRIELLSAVVSR